MIDIRVTDPTDSVHARAAAALADPDYETFTRVQVAWLIGQAYAAGLALYEEASALSYERGYRQALDDVNRDWRAVSGVRIFDPREHEEAVRGVRPRMRDYLGGPIPTWEIPGEDSQPTRVRP
jgi:hypothetical protein